MRTFPGCPKAFALLTLLLLAACKAQPRTPDFGTVPVPIERNDRYAIAEDGWVAVVIPLSKDVGKASSPEVSGAAFGTVGTLVLGADTLSFTYRPSPNAHGTEFLAYSVRGTNLDQRGTIYVFVAPEPDPPVVEPQVVEIPEQVPTAFGIRYQNPDGGEATVLCPEWIRAGTLRSLGADRLELTPSSHFFGTATVTCTLRTSGGTVSFPLTFNVRGPKPTVTAVTAEVAFDYRARLRIHGRGFVGPIDARVNGKPCPRVHGTDDGFVCEANDFLGTGPADLSVTNGNGEAVLVPAALELYSHVDPAFGTRGVAVAWASPEEVRAPGSTLAFGGAKLLVDEERFVLFHRRKESSLSYLPAAPTFGSRLTRFTRDGRLDSTFGQNGTSAPMRTSGLDTDPTAWSAQALSPLAVVRSGERYLPFFRSFETMFGQLSLDGQRSTVVTKTNNSRDQVLADAVVAADGTTYLASVGVGVFSGTWLERVLPNATVDRAFLPESPHEPERSYRILRPNAKLALVEGGTRLQLFHGERRPALVQFQLDGRLDLDFGVDGVMNFDLGASVPNDHVAGALAIHRGERSLTILVEVAPESASPGWRPPHGYSVCRFDLAGRRIRSFGTDGCAFTGFAVGSIFESRGRLFVAGTGGVGRIEADRVHALESVSSYLRGVVPAVMRQAMGYDASLIADSFYDAGLTSVAVIGDDVYVLWGPALVKVTTDGLHH